MKKLPESFDVCMVCALPEEAGALLEVVRQQCGNVLEKRNSPRYHYPYHFATIKNNKDEPLNLHISWLSRYGPSEMTLHLSHVLEECQPRIAIMTGICAGDAQRVQLGDLVVAERTFTYDNGKFTLDEHDRRVHEHDALTYQLDATILQFVGLFDDWKPLVASLERPPSKRQQREWLLNRLLNEHVPSIKEILAAELEYHAPAWRRIVHELQSGTDPLLTSLMTLQDKAKIEQLRYGRDPFPYIDPPKASRLIKPIASGSAVRSDDPFKDIRVPVRGTVAIDMEGAAFGLVASRYPLIPWLAVKGVCDYADRDKDDTYHDYAAQASAAYALSFIRAYVTSEHLPRPDPSSFSSQAGPLGGGNDLSQQDREEQEYRQRLLQAVRDFWIEKMLNPLLNEAPLIPLELHERPAALDDPWISAIQEAEQPEHALPSGTSLLNIYDDGKGKLLILGETGSGKTTLLLELARSLLERAEQNKTSSIPVIFPLSLRGAVEERSLSQWFIDELNSEKYGRIPLEISLRWLEHDQLILILDGFEEVPSKYRELYIHEINAYQGAHLSTSVVVCSRSTEYHAQNNRLRLRRAIVLQPLTMKQIDEYLSNAGSQLDAVRVALHEDPTLNEAITTPLLLRVLARTYRGKSLQHLRAISSRELWQQIFEDYVQYLFKRRKQETPYTPQQSISWLAWLARQMKQEEVSRFYIEGMHPGLLSTKGFRLSYCLLMLLLCGLTGGPLGWFLGNFFGGVSGGLLGLLIPTLFLWGRTIGFCHWYISLGSHAWVLDNPPYWPLLRFFPSQRAFLTRYAQYMTTGMQFCINCLSALLWSLFLAGSSLLSWSHFPLWDRLETPCLGVFFFATLLFFAMFSATAAPTKRSVLGFSLLNGISLSFLALVVVLRAPSLHLSIPLACILFSFWGLFQAMFQGAYAIEYLILRLLLWLTGRIPWNYSHFLDYAAERGFLRGIEGGYDFDHQLLREYFASLKKRPVYPL